MMIPKQLLLGLALLPSVSFASPHRSHHNDCEAGDDSSYTVREVGARNTLVSFGDNPL